MPNDVTAAVKTFLRDRSLHHCVQTLRAQYPDMPIIVADDGHCTDEKEERLLAAGVSKYLRLPWNVGLSAGRNALVDACETPYILMCEDDFSFTPNSHVERLRQLMDIADIAAGLVFNVRHWACHNGGMGWDPFGGKFVNAYGRVFRAGFTGDVKEYEGIHYEEADFVLNFFVARLASLRNIRWDEELQLAFEHLDFFLRAKAAGIKSVRSSDVMTLHKEIDDSHNPEYQKFRNDYEKYREPFKKKWGFDWIHDLPGGIPSPPITIPNPIAVIQPVPSVPITSIITPIVPVRTGTSCNRHNTPSCVVCIRNGWQFQEEISVAPTAPVTPRLPISPQPVTRNFRINAAQRALFQIKKPK